MRTLFTSLLALSLFLVAMPTWAAQQGNGGIPIADYGSVPGTTTPYVRGPIPKQEPGKGKPVVYPSTTTPPRIQIPLFDFPPTQGSTTAPIPTRRDPLVEQTRNTFKRSIALLDAAVTRAEGLLARTESRIAKLASPNATASAQVTVASTELQTARDLLTQLESGIDTATGTSTASFTNAKNAIHDVNDHLKLALAALQKALNALL